MGEQVADKAVVVIEFVFDPVADVNPIQVVVEGLREYFADREPSPVGHIWVGTHEYAEQVLAVQQDAHTPPAAPGDERGQR